MNPDCVYCGHEFLDTTPEDDHLVCVASGDDVCGECRHDHVEHCSACSAEIYAE